MTAVDNGGKRTILFVCGHNAGRSQMAEAFLNKMAAERSMPVTAESAGTAASAEINPAARAAMAEVGLFMEGQQPKLLTAEMAARANRTITMGCGVDVAACPAKFMVTEDWNLDDPAGQPIQRVREIRDEIRRRVEQLLNEIETEYRHSAKDAAN